MAVLRILYAVVSLIAIYMSFRRNRGFNFGSFLLALLFPPIYIVYCAAVPIKGVAYSKKPDLK